MNSILLSNWSNSLVLPLSIGGHISFEIRQPDFVLLVNTKFNFLIWKSIDLQRRIYCFYQLYLRSFRSVPYQLIRLFISLYTITAWYPVKAGVVSANTVWEVHATPYAFRFDKICLQPYIYIWSKKVILVFKQTWSLLNTEISVWNTLAWLCNLYDPFSDSLSG